MEYEFLKRKINLFKYLKHFFHLMIFYLNDVFLVVKYLNKKSD